MVIQNEHTIETAQMDESALLQYLNAEASSSAAVSLEAYEPPAWIVPADTMLWPDSTSSSHLYDHPTLIEAVRDGNLPQRYFRPLEHLKQQKAKPKKKVHRLEWASTPRPMTEDEVETLEGCDLHAYRIGVLADISRSVVSSLLCPLLTRQQLSLIRRSDQTRPSNQMQLEAVCTRPSSLFRRFRRCRRHADLLCRSMSKVFILYRLFMIRQACTLAQSMDTCLSYVSRKQATRSST